MNLHRAAVVAALVAPAILCAQAVPGGPYAPSVLLFPSGPRTLAMGNTGVASRDDEVLFFNPAQLAIARGMSASMENYSGLGNGGALSSVTRFSTGGIAVGMRVLNYDTPFGMLPINRTTATDPNFPSGTSFEAVAGLAQVLKGVRVGASAKYAQDQLAGTQLGRAAFDVGLAKDFFRFYTVGLAVQNIGSSMTAPCGIVSGATNCPSPLAEFPRASLELPLETTLGVATSRALGEFDVVGTAALSMLRANYLTPSGGVEVGYSWLDGYAIALRVGGRRPLPGEEGLTGGVGFTMDRLSIDYAVETLSNSHVGQRIGLRIR
jgi:hypothetical protein